MATHVLQIEEAQADRRAGRWTLRRFLVENGLSLVVLSLFLIFTVAQTVAGLRAYNAEQLDHGQPAIALGAYLGTGHFWEALSENWESEFLQMAAFVWLTSFLFQKGSPESSDPYADDDVAPVTEDSPYPVRKGGWLLKLYENSLSLAFLLMFLISFAIHVIAGAKLYNEEQMEHGQELISIVGYLGTSQLWFESFQNWQSEFLAIAAMVILSIFLRQRGSAESKPVERPHWENE